MKAFIITLDALAAISLTLLVIILVMSQTVPIGSAKSVYLKQVSMDILGVLEKSGRLDIAIEGNSNPAREVLHSTTDPVCISITISDMGENQLLTIVKPDCGQGTNQIQSLTKPMVHDGKAYIVQAQSWYRGAS